MYSKPPAPPLNLNSSDIEKDIFQALSNEKKAEVLRNSLDSGVEVAHVRQLISLAKVNYLNYESDFLIIRSNQNQKLLR
jgi:DNA-binding transcriptional ArsR family regulator